MSSLTAPLKDNFGINHFSYVKFFNNKVFEISNNLKWTACIIDNKYYELDYYQEHINNLKHKPVYKVLWDYESNPVITHAINNHNLWHALTVYVRLNEHIEMYSFATTEKDNTVISLYMNNFIYLERFIFYFKNKAKELISIQGKEPLFLQRKELTFNYTSNSSDIREKGLLNQTQIKRFFVGQVEIAPSAREIDCLYLLHLGYSIKKSATILNISPRTVEYYLNNIKEKLGCCHRQELVDFYRKELEPYYKAEKGI